MFLSLIIIGFVLGFVIFLVMMEEKILTQIEVAKLRLKVLVLLVQGFFLLLHSYFLRARAAELRLELKIIKFVEKKMQRKKNEH